MNDHQGPGQNAGSHLALSLPSSLSLPPQDRPEEEPSAAWAQQGALYPNHSTWNLNMGMTRTHLLLTEGDGGCCRHRELAQGHGSRLRPRDSPSAEYRRDRRNQHESSHACQAPGNC